jgi:hypothetical protein
MCLSIIQCVLSNEFFSHFCEMKKTILTIFVNFLTIVFYGKKLRFFFSPLKNHHFCELKKWKK